MISVLLYVNACTRASCSDYQWQTCWSRWTWYSISHKMVFWVLSCYHDNKEFWFILFHGLSLLQIATLLREATCYRPVNPRLNWKLVWMSQQQQKHRGSLHSKLPQSEFCFDQETLRPTGSQVSKDKRSAELKSAIQFSSGEVFDPLTVALLQSQQCHKTTKQSGPSLEPSSDGRSSSIPGMPGNPSLAHEINRQSLKCRDTRLEKGDANPTSDPVSSIPQAPSFTVPNTWNPSLEVRWTLRTWIAN